MHSLRLEYACCRRHCPHCHNRSCQCTCMINGAPAYPPIAEHAMYGTAYDSKAKQPRWLPKSDERNY